MTELMILFFVLAIIFLAVAFATPKGNTNYPYVAAGPLLTAAEKNFYDSLKKVIPVGYVVSFKVRMGDVLSAKKGLDKKTGMIMRAKIQQKHFDFVLCEESTMKVSCCIELNDSSHQRKDRIKRDVFVRAACSAAGVPLLEIKNSRKYDLDDVHLQVVSALNPTQTHAVGS